MGKHSIPKIGESFAVKCSGFVAVVEYVNASNVLVQDADGNSRRVSAADLRDGVKWRNDDGSLTIARSRKLNHKASRRDQPLESKPKRDHRFSPKYPTPEKNYVYTVSISGEVVYVGMGVGLRYTHCYSGKSCSRELNRLYFQRAPMIVEVYRSGLDRAEAKTLERRLIAALKPRCNEVIYK